ncbi:MAG: hypothetical protein QM695_12675 [Micropruina sp.]
MITSRVPWISADTIGSMNACARADLLDASCNRCEVVESRPTAKALATNARMVSTESSARVTSAT